MVKRGLSPFSPSRHYVAIVRRARLFIVPVRAATPSKYRDEISFRGEGYDTLGVTIVEA
jgi:hypothetical protein